MLRIFGLGLLGVRRIIIAEAQVINQESGQSPSPAHDCIAAPSEWTLLMGGGGLKIPACNLLAGRAGMPAVGYKNLPEMN